VVDVQRLSHGRQQAQCLQVDGVAHLRQLVAVGVGAHRAQQPPQQAQPVGLVRCLLINQ